MNKTLITLIACAASGLPGSAAQASPRGYATASSSADSGQDWPQFQCNAARTGWTPDSPAPPYEEVYFLDFMPEPLGMTQPIIHGHVLFVPTLAGRLYAFKPETGERLWVKEGFGPMERTPAAGNGLVFVADIYGVIHAVNAVDGEPAWKRDLGFSVSATPCLDNGVIYIGRRDGLFFALDAATGKSLWETRLDHYVWAGAAAAGGKVYVGTDGELHVYCLDAGTGSVLWKTGKIPGVIMRDYCPVIAGDKVIVRTLPAAFLNDDGWVPKPYDVWGPHNRADFMKYHAQLRHGELPDGFMPDEFKAANEKIVEYYKNNPLKRTMFVFDSATGKEPYIAGAFHAHAGWGMACPPPAVDSEGMLQVAVYFQSTRYGRLDPATGLIRQIIVGPVFKKQYESGDEKPDPVLACQYGAPNVLDDGSPKERYADGISGNNDEAHMSSCGGDRIYWMHFTCSFGNFAYNIKTHELNSLVGRNAGRKTIKATVGEYRPGSVRKADMANTGDGTHSESYTAPAIWGDMLFYHSAAGGILAIKGQGGAQ